MEKREKVEAKFAGSDSAVEGVLSGSQVILYSHIGYHEMPCVDESIKRTNARLVAACETLRIKCSEASDSSTIASASLNQLIKAAEDWNKQVFPILYKLEQAMRPLEFIGDILELQKKILMMYATEEKIDADFYSNEFLCALYKNMLRYKDLVSARDGAYRGSKIVALSPEQILVEIGLLRNSLITPKWIVANRSWVVKRDIPIEEQIKNKANDLASVDENIKYIFDRKTMLLQLYQGFCLAAKAKAEDLGEKTLAAELDCLKNYADCKDITDSAGTGNIKISDAHVLDLMIRTICDDNEFNIIINEFPKKFPGAVDLLRTESRDSLLLRSKLPMSVEKLVEILSRTKKQTDVYQVLINRGVSELAVYNAILTNPNVELDFDYIDDEAKEMIAELEKNSAKPKI